MVPQTVGARVVQGGATWCRTGDATWPIYRVPHGPNTTHGPITLLAGHLLAGHLLAGHLLAGNIRPKVVILGLK